MKTRSILLCLLSLLLFYSGCREISVTTTVNRDGSLLRIIRITGDSSSVFKGDLPYPVDSTWERVAVKDTSAGDADRDDYILTYTKMFSSDNPLNTEIASDTSWRRNLQRNITVDRRFGFFYSYLTFRETFQPANPFTRIPYSEYLMPEDLEWLSGQKPLVTRSDSLRFDEAEEKALDYLAASVSQELESILEEGIARLDDPSLTPGDVTRWHDSIFRFVEQWEFSSPEKLLNDFRRWTGKPAVELLYDKTAALFDEFEKRACLLDTIVLMESYPETVEMPGLITRTNSTMLKGNRVSWEVQPLNLLFTEYELVVESRVVNNWAFVLTGVILLLLVVVLIVKSVKRNPN